MIALFAVLVFSLFTILPFHQSGFYSMHDDTQVARVYEMTKALQDGMFPVRWVMDLGYGYGYPIFNFYAPLAYYVGSLFDLIGFNTLDATKLMIVSATLLAGFSMFLFGRSVWGLYGGIISSLLYMYSPYHALDIYVRGAISELWAYALLPFIFYGIYKMYKTSQIRYGIITAFSFASLVISHNLTAFMSIPFILAFIIFLHLFIFQKKKILIQIVVSLLTGLCLSAFYWLPAIMEMRYTNVASQVGGGADYRDHFVCFNQLWNSQWGFGGSIPGCIDGMSFKIGKLHILMGIAAIIVGLFFQKDKKKRNSVTFLFIIFSVVSLALSIFMTTFSSKSIWETAQVMGFIQYPWRFLLFVSFFISILGGAVVYFFEVYPLTKVIRSIIMVIFVAAVIGINYSLFTPQTWLPRTEASYIDPRILRFATSKISDEYMPSNFSKPHTENEVPRQLVVVEKGNATVKVETYLTHKVKIQVSAAVPTDLLIHIAPFPAWEFLLNAQKISHINGKNGVMIHIPQGEHILTVIYRATSIEKIANSISLIGFFMLITGIIYGVRKRIL